MSVEATQLVGTTGGGTPLTASGNGPGVAVPPGENVAVTINVFSATGTTPSATFEVQWSVDGINWQSAEAPDTFTAITAGKNVVKTFVPKGRIMRLAYTITGTTPNLNTAAFVTGQSNTLVRF